MAKILSRLVKYLNVILIVTLVIVGVWAYRTLSLNQTERKYPYSYIVDYEQYENLKPIKDVDILILGDRFGKKLDDHLEVWKEYLKKNFGKDFKVANWSEENQSLSRSLAIIKQLNVLPPIIIYHGGAQEFYEEKVVLKDIDKIYENINTYYSSKKTRFLLHWKPWTSRFIYKPYQYKILRSSIDEFSMPKWKDKNLIYREIIYKNYKRELIEFTRYIGKMGSQVILTTLPLKFDKDESKICSANVSVNKEQLAKAKELIEQQKYKESLELLEQLKNSSIGWAHVYKLLGDLYFEMKEYKKAYEHFEKMLALDCANFGPNPIFNRILRSESTRRALSLVDFELVLKIFYGSDVLFQHNDYPQNIYYQRFFGLLTNRVLEVASSRGM